MEITNIVTDLNVWSMMPKISCYIHYRIIENYLFDDMIRYIDIENLKSKKIYRDFEYRDTLVSIYILIVMPIKMSALPSKHDVEVFEDSDDECCTFSLENTTWKKLEQQRHKVIVQR